MSLWSRISNAVRGERLNREIEEELQSHLDEAIASGRDPKEARRAFGSVLRRAKRVTAFARPDGSSRFSPIYVSAGGSCGRNKVTSVAAVLSLALGIGSCVAAFRLIDALLWRPLPIAHASKLYILARKMTGLYGRPVEDGYWSTPDFKLMREAVKDQADLIAISDADRTDITWSPATTTWRRPTLPMFPATCLRSSALSHAGPTLLPGDDRGPGASPYAVLSWDYWNHRFGRDPHVLGRTVHIGDQSFEIIGVGPRDFTGTEKGTVTDIFLPLNMNSAAAEDRTDWHHTFLMLKPGCERGYGSGALRQHLSAVSHAFEVRVLDVLSRQ